MALWRRTIQPPTDEQAKEFVADSVNRTLKRMEYDRPFWDEVVRMMLDEETRPANVPAILEVADQLTAARRERFPSREPN